MPTTASTSAAPDKTAAAPKNRRRAPLSLAAWKQFVNVAKPYWLGDQKKRAWTLLALLIVLMLVETKFAVMLNDQAGEMTSALAAKDGDRFWAIGAGLPARPGLRGADLRLLLLHARPVRQPVAALAHRPLPRRLSERAHLLRAGRRQRDRQPRPAHQRRHQHVYRQVDQLPADLPRLAHAAGGLQRRAVVDLAPAGGRAGGVRAGRHRRRAVCVRQSR